MWAVFQWQETRSPFFFQIQAKLSQALTEKSKQISEHLSKMCYFRYGT